MISPQLFLCVHSTIREGEEISYGCSCSTNDDFDLLRAGPELRICPVQREWTVLVGESLECKFCVYTSSITDGRFLIGAEQGPVMNQGDGILVLIRSMVTRNMASSFEYWQQVSKIK